MNFVYAVYICINCTIYIPTYIMLFLKSIQIKKVKRRKVKKLHLKYLSKYYVKKAAHALKLFKFKCKRERILFLFYSQKANNKSKLSLDFSISMKFCHWFQWNWDFAPNDFPMDAKNVNLLNTKLVSYQYKFFSQF